MYCKYKVKTKNGAKYVIKKNPDILHISVTLFYSHIFLFTFKNNFFIISYRDVLLFVFNISVYTFYHLPPVNIIWWFSLQWIPFFF